ncbi:MAG: hypothetical protein IJV72_08485 [Clostridia bacterium]|nr:hypothetical protein [Clostridia bacterium]
MAASKNKVTRVLISIIFIAISVGAVIGAIQGLLELDLIGVISSYALMILMFVTGIVGMFDSKIKVCRVLGVIICILSALNFILALAGGRFDTMSLVQALLAWIYFDCT